MRTNHDGVLEFSVHLKKQILMLKGTTWEVPIIYQKYKINKIIRQSWRVYFINTTSSRKLLSWRKEFYWDHNSNRWSQIPFIYIYIYILLNNDWAMLNLSTYFIFYFFHCNNMSLKYKGQEPCSWQTFLVAFNKENVKVTNYLKICWDGG